MGELGWDERKVEIIIVPIIVIVGSNPTPRTIQDQGACPPIPPDLNINRAQASGLVPTRSPPAIGREEVGAWGQERELAVVWDGSVRRKFVKFMMLNKVSEEYLRKSILSYLDRYMPPGGLSKPEDVVNMFVRCERGQRHLKCAVQALLRFYRKALGYPREFIEALSEAIPSISKREDKWVPPEGFVIDTLKELKEANPGLFVFINAMLDSGTRKEHLAKMFEHFRPETLEGPKKPGGFYKYRLNLERGTKNTWLIYLTPYTAQLLKEFHARGEHLSLHIIDHWFKTHRRKVGKRPDGKALIMPLRPKYVRKFAYNMMRKMGIDRDVAMWLNGRKPESVDERHYTDLELLADQQYPRYMAYLAELRRKAGLKIT